MKLCSDCGVEIHDSGWLCYSCGQAEARADEYYAKLEEERQANEKESEE